MNDNNSNMDDNDIKNMNDDTMYFDDNRDYEVTSKAYSDSDISPSITPMGNANSVEYDEDDYESERTGKDDPSSQKKVIMAYIFTLVVIIIIIFLAVFKILK